MHSTRTVDVACPLVALVGFKRHKLAIAGGVRVLVVSDDTVRLVDKRGSIDLETAVDQLTATLTTTGVVQLRWPSGSAYIYAVLDMTRISPALREILMRERDGAELIGPIPAGHLGYLSPKTPMKQARIGTAILDALHWRGVQGSEDA